MLPNARHAWIWRYPAILFSQILSSSVRSDEQCRWTDVFRSLKTRFIVFMLWLLPGYFRISADFPRTTLGLRVCRSSAFDPPLEGHPWEHSGFECFVQGPKVMMMKMSQNKWWFLHIGLELNLSGTFFWRNILQKG